MSTPIILTARELDMSYQNVFGPLGPELHLTLHHSAGPTDRDLDHALALWRSYHRAHKDKGWGGEGYHYGLPRHRHGGRLVIVCLRPTALKGAHVGGHNSNNVGVSCLGTTGDRPTQTQVEAFRWLLVNAHRHVMPKAHRTDRPLNRPHTDRRGHNDWSGHESNACPGTHRPLLDLRTR